MSSVTLSVAISRPVKAVYRFLADPATMPQWAIHNVKSIRPLGGSRTGGCRGTRRVCLPDYADPAGLCSRGGVCAGDDAGGG